jgi:hypothetical protein
MTLGLAVGALRPRFDTCVRSRTAKQRPPAKVPSRRRREPFSRVMPLRRSWILWTVTIIRRRRSSERRRFAGCRTSRGNARLLARHQSDADDLTKKPFCARRPPMRSVSRSGRSAAGCFADSAFFRQCSWRMPAIWAWPRHLSRWAAMRGCSHDPARPATSLGTFLAVWTSGVCVDRRPAFTNSNRRYQR